MEHYFGTKKCGKCDGSVDMIATRCPHCHANLLTDENDKTGRDLRSFLRFDNFVQVSIYKQIAFFLTGFLGFQVLGILLSLLFQSIGIAALNLHTVEEIKEFSQRIDIRFWINIAAYLSIAVALALILWKRGWKEIFHSFKKGKSYMWAGIGFGIILTANFIYNLIVNIIFMATGFKAPEVNANEAALRSMLDVNLPVFFLIIGFIGPFVEEMAYRVGLFSFLSRTKRWIAYVVSGLVFGLIHYSWDFSSAEVIITELVNIPTYIGAGLVMAFVYEKGGFAGSYLTHVSNNVFSIIGMLLRRLLPSE